MVTVLFVCLGNICRSPTADGILRHQLKEAGLSQHIEVDSAGTGDWHIGKAPDPRTVAAARQRGYDLSTLRARQVQAEDFHRFDHVLAMDRSNLEHLQAMQPADSRAELRLLLDFHPRRERPDALLSRCAGEVPDPYYGEAEGFEEVLDLVEQACAGLLQHIRQRHGLVA